MILTDRNFPKSGDVIAAVPFFQPKKAQLDWLATQKDRISWTAIITGPFFDWVSSRIPPYHVGLCHPDTISRV